MAQLVAHLHGMQGVRGSNPLRSTKITPSSIELGVSYLPGSRPSEET